MGHSLFCIITLTLVHVHKHPLGAPRLINHKTPALKLPVVPGANHLHMASSEGNPQGYPQEAVLHPPAEKPERKLEHLNVSGPSFGTGR